MSTMKNFHQLLNDASSESKDSYMTALAKLTKVERSQLSALASNLDWQTWVDDGKQSAGLIAA